ncbi:MAG: glycosyltransferase, partial [bacterium]|nr:glycosyltransferase [bacterium]
MAKILYLITQSDMGGAQKYVFDLTCGFKNEFELIVAAGKGTNELFSFLKEKKINHLKLNHLSRLPNPLKAFLAVLEIRRLLKKEKPNILHLNSTTAGFLGSLAVLGLKIKPKVVYTVHGWAFLEPGIVKQKLFYLFEKITSKIKNKFIVLSNYEKQVALKKKISKENQLEIIPNGINNLTFLNKEQAREKLNLPSNVILVGTIANAYKAKGLKYLLKAHALALNYQLVIIGDGPEKKKLQKQFPLSNFLEKIENASKYLKAFDIFCLPSVKEGFPFALLEAMQAQLPIIATKVGAIP